ncbi:RNA polymerase factor sigma-54 [Candidatus Margulisiibacteriota bacterium]
MNQRQEQSLRQTLEFALSPKIIQMLKILNLSYLELVEKIEKEAEENVTLDIERQDRLAAYIGHIAQERIPKKEIKDELPGIETLETLPETLEEHLLRQLELEDLSPKYDEIARYLIGNLDERGYIKDYPKIKESAAKKLKASTPTIDKILKIIQKFEPEGVGARNLKECLLIQIEEYNFENEGLRDVLEKAVKHYLEDLANKDFKKVSANLSIKEEGARNLSEFIKNNLNPNPGSNFSSRKVTIIPSFTIEKQKNKYTAVNLEKKYGPLLKVNPKYHAMLEDPNTDKETKDFLRTKFGSAKELLENISRRHETIEKIMGIITDTQNSFFEKGAIWLKPLQQKDIAGTVGVHPSTISRALAGKYIQTPQGLFQLKYLCPREFKGHTVERVKKLITQIVENEKKALSDEDIKGILQKEGVTIERRTVAEYRKELSLPSSSKRVKS